MTKTKLYSLLFVSAIITLFACQREPDFIDPGGQQSPTISSKDPQKISAAIKVWHGVRTQGSMPAPRGNSLQLESPSQSFIQAFNGRYVVIYPEVLQGDVLGYYVQVQGASEHFKVDYTKPRITGRMPAKRSGSAGLFSGQTSRTQSGNADSAIVIALPANLQVPDTICISYCAYDPAGNVSNVISNCIVVNSVGTTTAGNWLNGTWRITAQWDSTGSDRDTIIYNRWVSGESLQCYYDSSQGLSYVVHDQGNNAPFIGADSMFYQRGHLSLSSTGGMRYDLDLRLRTADLSASTCSQLVFRQDDHITDTLSGAWNYNPATGKAVFVFEFDDYGQPVLEAWEYNIIKVNDRNMILYDPIEHYFARFEW